MVSNTHEAASTQKEHKFFVFTQSHGSSPASLQAQTSAVRSHLATQQHARRRNKEHNQFGENFSHAFQRKRRTDARQSGPPDATHQDDVTWERPLQLRANFTASQSITCQNLQRGTLDLTFAGASSMVSFPLKLSAEEYYALHFYLTFGRRKLLGTSTNMKYCPFSDLAQSLIQVCPIYILAHVVLGEMMLSECTQKPARPQYYARSAQLYKAVSLTLANKKATFYHKLWAIIQAAMVERTARRRDLQTMHNRALDDLFESQGGIVASCRPDADDIYLDISARLYAGLLARTAAVVPVIRQFSTVKKRFILALVEVQRRVEVCRSEFAYHDGRSVAAPQQLNHLKAYLDLFSQRRYHERASQQFSEYELGALFCLLSMARTLVDCPCSEETTLEFFCRVQESLYDSSQSTSHSMNAPHPAVTAYGISCVRSEIFPQNYWQTEFKISQTLVDAHRLFFLASPVTRTKIIVWLVACISTTVHSMGHGAEFEDKSETVREFNTQMLSNELELSWQTKKSET